MVFTADPNRPTGDRSFKIAGLLQLLGKPQQLSL